MYSSPESEFGVLFDTVRQEMVGYLPVNDISLDVKEKDDKLSLTVDKNFEGGMMGHSIIRLTEKPTLRVPLVHMRTAIYGPGGENQFDNIFSTHDAVFGDTTGDGWMDYGVFHIVNIT